MATHSRRQKGRQPHKKKICEICGDIGFQAATITCYQCKDADVHEYCVVGCYEDAPDDWCCEECVRKSENKYSKGFKLHASTNICQSNLPPKKHIKFCSRHGIKWEKEMTGKTNIHVEEALSLLNTASSKGLGGSTIMELRSPDALKASGMMKPPMTYPYDPALVHSWKGSFDISGALEFAPGMLNNYIQAHPPSRVRRKVFSRLLPHILKFEFVSCGDIWASLFNDHCARKEDIGLYFLANERERPASAFYIYIRKGV